MNRFTPLRRHTARLQLAESRIWESPQAKRNTIARFVGVLELMAARFLLSVFSQGPRLTHVSAVAWRGRHATLRAR